MVEVSIIIRTKNEERWISSCLQKIFEQSFKNFEVIIVDNYSSDKTLRKIKNYNIKKILKIKNYTPGKSLNLGIKNSSGKYIVIISAHCLPKNNLWLEKLVKSIKSNKKIAGVYGRQEPMSFSSPSDKRDLMIVFGLDKKIQKKDSFFHNANSIIKKNLWQKIRFDENVTNIEDRIWAKDQLNKGHTIMYEPQASVYHYHGIHHGGDAQRLDQTINVIEKNNINYKSGKIDPNKINIVAIIPLKGETNFINDIPLLSFTINSIKKSKYVNKIIVSTDNKKTAKIANESGAETPFLRPKILSEGSVNLEQVQQYSLDQIEKIGIFPDLIFHLEETFPFRPDGFIDSMINNLLVDGYDSVVAARRETGWIWQENARGYLDRIDSGDVPREFKEQSFVGLHGLGCVTHPEFVRKGNLLGNKTGLFKIDNFISSFEVRDENSSFIASQLI